MKMERVLQMTALCVVSALLALVLKRTSPEQGLLLTLAAVTVVLLTFLEAARGVLVFLRELAARSGIQTALFEPLYKVAGISLVVKVGGNLCRDAGESALGTALESMGTLCGVLAALPLLRYVLTMLLELME